MSRIDATTPSIQARLSQEGVAFVGAIAAAAQRHGVDPQLLAAVAAQETGGPGTNAGANIVGDGGHGRGLFQIDDRWHPFAREPAAMDPAKNADYAAGMIAGLLKRYGGDVHKALSAYNAGSPTATGTVTQWGDGKRLGYADSVLRHYASLGNAPVNADSKHAIPARRHAATTHRGDFRGNPAAQSDAIPRPNLTAVEFSNFTPTRHNANSTA